jgi:hypothetical protein
MAQRDTRARVLLGYIVKSDHALLLKRLFDIGDDVLEVFDANAQP